MLTAEKVVNMTTLTCDISKGPAQGFLGGLLSSNQLRFRAPCVLLAWEMPAAHAKNRKKSQRIQISACAWAHEQRGRLENMLSNASTHHKLPGGPGKKTQEEGPNESCDWQFE